MSYSRNHSTNQDRLYTVSEAAQFIHCSERTLRKWISQQKIPAHKVGGKWLLLHSELIDWVRQQ